MKTAIVSLFIDNDIISSSLEREQELWSALRKMGNKCPSQEGWIAITDFQKEDDFVDISKYFYKEIFEFQRKDFGRVLKEYKHWQLSQPNGGIQENCVVSQADIGWYDVSCTVESCSICSIRIYMPFYLRGLCKLTK